MPVTARTPFKDEINPTSIKRLADAVAAVDPSLDVTGFRRRATRGLGTRELKARVDHVADALGWLLADRSFPDAAQVLVRAADGADLGQWEAWPAVTFIEHRGLDHPRPALDALSALTCHASAEFAVRPYVLDHREIAMEAAHRWTTSTDVHRRRLASEGLRPRLPWGRRLGPFIEDPTALVEVLDALVDDPDEYVRRSVANNLNDIAKDHPDLAVSIAQRWGGSGGEHIASTVRHGLRTLVKQGHPGAMVALGFDPDAAVEVTAFELTPAAIAVGDRVHLEVHLANPCDEPVAVVVDYSLQRPTATGATSTKVFKWRTLTLAAGTSTVLRRHHHLRPVTVRDYHPGTYAVQIQVNGVGRQHASFEVRADR